MKKMIFISFALLTFIACSHKVISTTTSSTASSPDKPKADANAMYVSEIKSILENKCTPCHFPDKGGFKEPLNDFASASKNIDDMIRRVQMSPSDPGYMPFKGKKEALTATEIASLKTWKAALGK